MKRASGENFQATSAFPNVFAVIEMEKYIVEEIDTSLLCDIQYPFRKKIEILFEF